MGRTPRLGFHFVVSSLVVHFIDISVSTTEIKSMYIFIYIYIYIYALLALLSLSTLVFRNNVCHCLSV